MHPLAVLQVLVLLALANGTPVIAKKLLGARGAWPVDGGLTVWDGRPLFGASKTWRGVALAIVVTTGASPLVGLDVTIGAVAGATAMAGDLCSSFLKRRLGFVSSSRAVGIDQVPESLLPFIACRAALPLSIADIVAGVAVFTVGEMLASRLLYRWHIRDRPY